MIQNTWSNRYTFASNFKGDINESSSSEKPLYTYLSTKFPGVDVNNDKSISFNEIAAKSDITLRFLIGMESILKCADMSFCNANNSRASDIVEKAMPHEDRNKRLRDIIIDPLINEKFRETIIAGTPATVILSLLKDNSDISFNKRFSLTMLNHLRQYVNAREFIKISFSDEPIDKEGITGAYGEKTMDNYVGGLIEIALGVTIRRGRKYKQEYPLEIKKKAVYKLFSQFSVYYLNGLLNRIAKFPPKPNVLKELVVSIKAAAMVYDKIAPPKMNYGTSSFFIREWESNLRSEGLVK
jgi:hypothetical protein